METHDNQPVEPPASPKRRLLWIPALVVVLIIAGGILLLGGTSKTKFCDTGLPMGDAARPSPEQMKAWAKSKDSCVNRGTVYANDNGEFVVLKWDSHGNLTSEEHKHSLDD